MSKVVKKHALVNSGVGMEVGEWPQNYLRYSEEIKAKNFRNGSEEGKKQVTFSFSTINI